MTCTERLAEYANSQGITRPNYVEFKFFEGKEFKIGESTYCIDNDVDAIVYVGYNEDGTVSAIDFKIFSEIAFSGANGEQVIIPPHNAVHKSIQDAIIASIDMDWADEKLNEIMRG